MLATGVAEAAVLHNVPAVLVRMGKVRLRFICEEGLLFTNFTAPLAMAEWAMYSFVCIALLIISATSFLMWNRAAILNLVSGEMRFASSSSVNLLANLTSIPALLNCS